ncbi:MAG: T9SS type A sorting domain-containing protein [candidate division KSB1 bacterium]|nr:T9SS type A sorting domain-containing protein [candidate division KSB1 bacterium]
MRDSLKTTTGDGTFDLSQSDEYLIDRPPHDRVYFEHQLLALRNYFYTVSNGKLVIESTVLPKGLTDSYALPHDMVYYSGEEDEQLQKQRWAELLRDAVTVAYQRDADVFSRFDALVIFHAGVGRDFAFDFNETPFDIQSAYIDLETLRETLGSGAPAYRGIELGSTVVTDGIILPETQCQKGYTLGLLGTAALLMGSKLGMPALFQTETGRPGIGRWGLMDQGSYNLSGLVPAHPSAWEKVFMGWEEPLVVNSLEQAVLGAFSTRSAPRIIKVPIHASEYFLLENRQRDPNGDGVTFGRDENGRRLKFDEAGRMVAEEGLRVITRVDEYDFGLPGSGILIWHIDERVIAERLASNTINNDPNRRGVDLIECDGPQDIGQVYSMFSAGAGTESGDYWDPYWEDNLSHRYVNKDRPVEFSLYSIPASTAHGRAYSHVRITNFGKQDSVMTLSIYSDYHRMGFPQFTGARFFDGSLVMFTASTNEKALAAVSSDGRLFAWKLDGAKVIANEATVLYESALGEKTAYPLALIGHTSASVDLPPAALDWTAATPGEELITVDRQGEVMIWSVVDVNRDGAADVLDRLRLDCVPTAGPILVKSRQAPLLYVGSQDGRVFGVQSIDGRLRLTFESRASEQPITALLAFANRLVAADAAGVVSIYETGEGAFRRLTQIDSGIKTGLRLVRGSEDVIYAVGTRGDFVVLHPDGSLSRGISASDFDSIGAPAVGDADRDGEVELLFFDGQRLGVYKRTGVTALNFPFTVQPAWEQEICSCSPVYAGSKSGPLIFIPIGSFLYAVDERGKTAPGFPLSCSAEITGSPLLWIDGDNKLSLFCHTADGFIYAWKTDLIVTPESVWSRFSGDSGNTFAFLPAGFSGGSERKEAPLEKMIFCHPNPASERTFIRYQLRQQAEAVSIRIYDIAGVLVTEIKDNPTQPGVHEAVWELGSVQSGAYLARVEIRGGDSLVKFIKIAVIK